MKTLWKRALSGALAVAVMATAAPGVPQASESRPSS